MHNFGVHFVTKGHKNIRWQNFIINHLKFAFSFTTFYLEQMFVMK